MSERERNIEQITDEERNHDAESRQDVEKDVVGFHADIFSSFMRSDKHIEIENIDEQPWCRQEVVYNIEKNQHAEIVDDGVVHTVGSFFVVDHRRKESCENVTADVVGKEVLCKIDNSLLNAIG